MIIFAFLLTTKTTVELTQYRNIKENMDEQALRLDQYHQRMDAMKKDIESLIDREEEIRGMLGEIPRSRSRFTASASDTFEDQFQTVQKTRSINDCLLFLKDYMSQLKVSFDRVYRKVQIQKTRFAATPSIWPVYGSINSGFGFRRHPITGSYTAHHGVDIPGWHGAPIKVTADGIVRYAGWKGTFGFVVLVDHDYGYRTVYAHLAKVMVRPGDRVKKGQVVGQMGTTGLSTGTHLHYEIQRWGIAINPVAYLDLDMYTASTKVW